MDGIENIITTLASYSPAIFQTLQGKPVQGTVLADAFTIDIRTKAEEVDKFRPAVAASSFISLILILLAITKFWGE